MGEVEMHYVVSLRLRCFVLVCLRVEIQCCRYMNSAEGLFHECNDSKIRRLGL